MAKISPLPLKFSGLHHIPGYPLQLDGLIDSILKIIGRIIAIDTAKQGLSNVYEIGGITATAREFLYGESPAASAESALRSRLEAIRNNPQSVPSSIFERVAASSGDRPSSAPPPTNAAVNPLLQLSLESPEQFSIGWTNHQNTYADALADLPAFAATMTDADAASESFWPTIAKIGLVLNAVFLEKVRTANEADVRARFQSVWTPAFETALAEGRLYAIDMTIFDGFPPKTVEGVTYFTPSTVTLLERDAAKTLTPVAVWASEQNGVGVRVYSRDVATDSAWIYALMAAKTSVMVWGIYLGHLYSWHLVPAAMLMEFLNNIPAGHPLYPLIEPQSKYVMQFDLIFALTSELILPFTSIANTEQFYQLVDRYAADYGFFDDDPRTRLAAQGIEEPDFSVHEPWDQYPLAGFILKNWEATADYVNVVVDVAYPIDLSVFADAALQSWMTAARDPWRGNIDGIPNVFTKDALKSVLTNLLHRITVHGASRLGPVSNPGLAFVPNSPPTLHTATLPDPASEVDQSALLAALPKTGVIGDTLNFYYIFWYSEPYESFVPPGGILARLPFPGGLLDLRNLALVGYRLEVIEQIESFESATSLIRQWPLSVET